MSDLPASPAFANVPGAAPAKRYGEWVEPSGPQVVPGEPWQPSSLRPLPDDRFPEVVARATSLYCPRNACSPAKVPLDHVRDALGRGQGGVIALEMWAVLATFRQPKHGSTAMPPASHLHDWPPRDRSMDTMAWPTLATVVDGIAARFGRCRTLRQVKEARRKLESVGLIRSILWSRRRRTGDGSRMSSLYIREVYGKMWRDLDGRWVVGVPARVARKIERAPRWGGRRDGSGPKPRQTRAPASIQVSPLQRPGHTRGAGSSQSPEVLLRSTPLPGKSLLPASQEEGYACSAREALRRATAVEASAAQQRGTSTPPPERAWPEKQDDASWLQREAGSVTSTISEKRTPPAGARPPRRGDRPSGAQPDKSTT